MKTPAVIAASLFALAAHAQSIRPDRPRCEYLDNPLAVAVEKPRLSWELVPSTPAARNLAQSAYRILVADSPAALESGRGTLWDSGKVTSAATGQIEYGGTPLSARQRAYWQVQAWDENGKPSAWSKPAMWAMGIADWGDARWIGDANPAPAEGFEPLPAPMLRRDFTHAGKPARATLYVSALGLYEASINGKKAGDHLLAPEWTDYTKRVQFQAFDVTDLVSDGANSIAVTLADGWYAGKIGLTGIVPKGPPRAIYGRQPKLLLRLEITGADGKTTAIVSDQSWKSTTEGPLRTADLLDGETFDATRGMPGWDRAGFAEDQRWKPVLVAEAPKAALVPQTNEPIRVTRDLTPTTITEPKPGVYVFDMGQNMVGWCRLRAKGEPGKSITLRHAEVLNPDGTIYTANLRGAKQTDTYTFRTTDEETYEPRFTYHGFRYVEVTGLASKPDTGLLVGRVLHSASPEVGTFECSDPMLNRLWQNIIWTQRANMHSTPTDCPQRDERCGWMGDILAFAPTACFNMDMAAFFTKWVPDTRDAQATDGRFADFSPQPFDPNARFSGVPAWGDAGVFVPWVQYQHYGDTRMLAEQYDACVKWVEFIKSKNADLLWKNNRGNDYGDWLNADTLKLQGWPQKGAEVPKHVFATMFFYKSTQIVSSMAKVLGRHEDAARYTKLASDIKDAFVKAYVSADGTMEGDTQAGYALALNFGLIPEDRQSAATARMVDRFKPYNGQISTGFHSTLPLMAELTKRGHNDLAYGLILNRKMPSWGYEIDHGATTIWERWDGYVEGRGYQDPGMNSFSHYAIGGRWRVDVRHHARHQAADTRL
jgi:alpha-L-rhamnosidase